MTEKVSMAELSDQLWKIEGLAASAPYPELKEKLELFGQFVGDWEMEDRYLKEDGTWAWEEAASIGDGFSKGGECRILSQKSTRRVEGKFLGGPP